MQEKEKILYIITKGNFGGAQRYVYDLATGLPKDKFEVVVACGDKEGDTLINLLTEKNVRVIKIEGLAREIDANNDFRVFKNLTKIIKEEQPNVVHLNSSKIGLLGSLAISYLKLTTKNCRPRSIFTAHGWVFNERQRSYLFKIAAYVSQYFTVLLCDKTIAVSEKTKMDINHFPLIKNKIKVVHNGISDFETLPKEEARRILASKDADKTIIFSIAELHKNKGIDVALKALSLLPEETKEKIIYCVAGNGEEKEYLEKLTKGLHIENIVRFLGFVPDAKKLLSGADIFLLPSRTEALPYVILEAGIAGLPTITTSVGGIPEVIHDMQNGILVHSRNRKEIAEAILYMLEHKDKQMEFGKEIRSTISNFFSLEKMLEETEKIYKLT
ncbi:MAG: hypothetical protein A3E02_00320 [Candidatus Zambryskibacteria bacterium RIFCSPHIGHO2_12_FULL_38_34]|uniref:Glycosyl transferase family 1 n=1 Tax=Candidatus Zambryskibacteria bacterium RIFCSPLOWO2_12_FULL_39_16 TaxID=1802775 RepID=A0A1G2UQG9_9BACT|nr:MAG: hypothetical protein A3E02_00320 [Candidatus Zambryskibacteria bacterium RIFCSPHIGHO2_12_FULL_38_34]OHB07672.1 MAG: hypothetical protein A3I19_00940 [Candidatus Zambryskibacteria bacterium RIFCSPLOWO2_02_FULL_38_13]OHB11638.1 MAG: hypothetical protein A3G46_02985 [Candidatus Zambryskibacteria bacterium RIFCSPLOWO2_12_FULL_39_16]